MKFAIIPLLVCLSGCASISKIAEYRGDEQWPIIQINRNFHYAYFDNRRIPGEIIWNNCYYQFNNNPLVKLKKINEYRTGKYSIKQQDSDSKYYSWVVPDTSNFSFFNYGKHTFTISFFNESGGEESKAYTYKVKKYLKAWRNPWP